MILFTTLRNKLNKIYLGVLGTSNYCKITSSTKTIKHPTYLLLKKRFFTHNSNQIFSNKTDLNEKDIVDSKKNDVSKRIDENNSESYNKSNLSKNKHTDSIQKEHKKSTKPLKNKPFIKTLFKGEYVYDYLKFPEYEHNFQLDKLNKNYVDPLQAYIHQNSNYDDIITPNGNFTQTSLKNFKQLNLYSMSFPNMYDGIELEAIGVTRLIEACSLYPSLGIHLIYNNEIASKCILLYGNKFQREKYLKKLANGDIKLGFCYSEQETGIDVASFNFTSEIANKNAPVEEQTFLLNGKKSWVSLLSTDQDENLKPNPNLSFIVVSKTIDNFDSSKEDDKCINLFIVDSQTEGIVIKKQHSSGNGLNLYEIEFKNVKVKTTESLLGTYGSGFEIKNKIIENSRFLVGAICVSILKDFLKETVKYCIETRRFGKSISENSIVKECIARVEANLYTMESMTYLCAGILDSYEHPDAGCESALTKIYCTETLKSSINDLLNTISMNGFTKLSKVQEKYLKDLNYLSAMLNTNDLLRLYVATNGLVMAGIEIHDSVRMLRNPLMHPSFFFKQIITNYRLSKSIHKQLPEYFFLWEHLHPSFAEQARQLEQSAARLIVSVKASLINQGRESVDYQTNLKRLSDISMHVFAMNSILARASRSYSIGLPHSRHEAFLAFIQSQISFDIVLNIHKQIANASQGSGYESALMNVADEVFRIKEHAAVHCLTRNY